jgi:hypothetical protein
MKMSVQLLQEGAGVICRKSLISSIETDSGNAAKLAKQLKKLAKQLKNLPI